MKPTRVTPGEYRATMAALGRVLEELEPTQEIARTSFPPMTGDDPLEATQPIYLPEDAFDGVRNR